MSDMGNRFRALDVLRGLTLALMIVVNMQIGERGRDRIDGVKITRRAGGLQAL